IPPSTTAIFYALLTDESVGKLFMSGIIPGVILTLAYFVIIYIWATIRPSVAPMLPADIKFTWGERFKSIAPIVPIMIIFLFMLGGIYMGWFSPTEAAGMGSFSVLVVCLVLRKLSWKTFHEGLLNTARSAGMILILISAAFIYTHTMALSKFSVEVQDIIVNAGLGMLPVTYTFVVVFILAGMFFDLWAMIILFTPIFYPIITGHPGAPPMAGIWLGCMFMLLCDLAAITPPMALCLYITQMIDGCPTIDVIKGTIPFYITCAGMLVLIVQFPFIATWLPGKMIGGG
ncbi:MAG: TRAP transporter large permease subunit, partial [Chloroflexota bacterium]